MQRRCGARERQCVMRTTERKLVRSERPAVPATRHPQQRVAHDQTPARAGEARPPGHDLAHFAIQREHDQAAAGVSAFAVDEGTVESRDAGRPLPAPVRGRMEKALGGDFSDIRVHEGPQAAAVGAVAFTAGSRIHFAPGRYQPGTASGQRLLAHELVHVQQQRAGRVRNPLGGVAVVEDRALEAEADRLGTQAVLAHDPRDAS